MAPGKVSAPRALFTQLYALSVAPESKEAFINNIISFRGLDGLQGLGNIFTNIWKGKSGEGDIKRLFVGTGDKNNDGQVNYSEASILGKFGRLLSGQGKYKETTGKTRLTDLFDGSNKEGSYKDETGKSRTGDFFRSIFGNKEARAEVQDRKRSYQAVGTNPIVTPATKGVIPMAPAPRGSVTIPTAPGTTITIPSAGGSPVSEKSTAGSPAKGGGAAWDTLLNVAADSGIAAWAVQRGIEAADRAIYGQPSNGEASVVSTASAGPTGSEADRLKYLEHQVRGGQLSDSELSALKRELGLSAGAGQSEVASALDSLYQKAMSEGVGTSRLNSGKPATAGVIGIGAIALGAFLFRRRKPSESAAASKEKPLSGVSAAKAPAKKVKKPKKKSSRGAMSLGLVDYAE